MKGGENGTSIKAGDRAESLLAKVITKQAKPYMPPRRDRNFHRPRLTLSCGGSIRVRSRQPTIGRSSPTSTSRRSKPQAMRSPHHRMAIGKNGQLAIAVTARCNGDKSFGGITGKVNAIAISPDEKTLAVAGGTPGLNGVATLFDLETGKN